MPIPGRLVSGRDTIRMAELHMQEVVMSTDEPDTEPADKPEQSSSTTTESPVSPQAGGLTPGSYRHINKILFETTEPEG